MKVSFLGAGAIGSMFGALLKHYLPECEVLLVARGAHGEAMAEQGAVELAGPWGDYRVPIDCSLDAREVAGSDVVFVTVKSQATEQALRQARDALGDATVVSIQNGINDAQFATWVPVEQTVMGMTTTNIAVTEPGRVSLQLDGPTIFGPPAGEVAGERVEQVVELLRHIVWPGLGFSSHPNLLGIRYNKLTINALGYASCLSASNFVTEALGCRAWRETVGRAIVRECHHVYAAAGVVLAPIPGRSDISRIERLMRVLDFPIVSGLVRRAVKPRFEKTPIVFSLYQDLLRGKPTEVEYINGQVVRLAESVGRDAPVNRSITQLTHELEERPAGTFFGRQEVVDRIARITRGSPKRGD